MSRQASAAAHQAGSSLRHGFDFDCDGLAVAFEDEILDLTNGRAEDLLIPANRCHALTSEGVASS